MIPRRPSGVTRAICRSLSLSLLLAATATAEPLRVVTVNLQGMRPDSNWQVRQFFIHQALVALDPDVVCLQEVCETLDGGGADNQARALAEALEAVHGGDYAWTFQATHIGWEQFREGVGLVSRLPVLESGFLQLVTGTFPRKVVWFRLQAEDGELQAFSTHLDHLSNAVRLQQATQVRGYVLQQLDAHPGSGAVLGGDFNATPASAPIRLFTEAGPDSLFSDAWATIHPGLPGWTMPSDNPAQRIDYLFSRAAAGPWTPDSCALALTMPYDGTHFPSDHFAVRADYTVETIHVDPAPARPRRAALGEPYPNPFNPEVTLPVELGRPEERLRLEVVDLLGRRLALLHDGPLAAGRHDFHWRDEHAVSGLRLVILETGDRRECRRILLVR
jgi:endonuclease/exonuclease/phosphatase family metal-dependent hydrolase